jgi:curved DNA-binding protein CbpA
MAAADQGGPAPDLYRLLGVPRDASREEIALAWRRRARVEHPDARPADADATDRFRALAQAWRVLGDPALRAAYDRALTRDQQAGTRGPAAPAAPTAPAAPAGPAAPVRVPVRHLRGSAGRNPAEPALRAGPVRVERPGPASPPRAEDEIRLAILAELAWRYLGRTW